MNPELPEKTNQPLFEKEQEQALLRLKELGVSGIEHAIPVEKELDGEQKEIEAEIFWVKFSGDNKCPSVEGKIYIPKSNDNRQLVLFSPGYPGSKAGQWEKKHAHSLIGEGYTIASLRHNSVAMKNQSEEDIFNCPERTQEAERKNEKYLGGEKEGGYALSDLIDEPVSAIKSLAPRMERIKLVGHSFGAACVWSAADKLKDDPEIVSKIDQLISLAGYLSEGKENADKIWQGTKMDLETFANFEMEDEKRSGISGSNDREKIKKGILDVAQRMKNIQIPEHIMQILVISPDDKHISFPDKMIVAGEGGKEVVSYDYPGNTARMLIVEDRTQEEKHHSLPGLLSENAIRGLKMRHSGKGAKRIIVEEKMPKRLRQAK